MSQAPGSRQERTAENGFCTQKRSRFPPRQLPSLPQARPVPFPSHTCPETFPLTPHLHSDLTLPSVSVQHRPLSWVSRIHLLEKLSPHMTPHNPQRPHVFDGLCPLSRESSPSRVPLCPPTPGQVLPILEESADWTRFGKVPLPQQGKGLLIRAPTGPALSPAVVLTALTDLHIFELFPRGGFPCGLAGKECACNARDPGSGRSPGEGKGYPLQYSGLENSTDCIVHRVTKNRTRLSDFHSLTHSLTHSLRGGQDSANSILPALVQ